MVSKGAPTRDVPIGSVHELDVSNDSTCRYSDISACAYSWPLRHEARICVRFAAAGLVASRCVAYRASFWAGVRRKLSARAFAADAWRCCANLPSTAVHRSILPNISSEYPLHEHTCMSANDLRQCCVRRGNRFARVQERPSLSERYALLTPCIRRVVLADQHVLHKVCSVKVATGPSLIIVLTNLPLPASGWYVSASIFLPINS